MDESDDMDEIDDMDETDDFSDIGSTDCDASDLSMNEMQQDCEEDAQGAACRQPLQALSTNV